MTDPTIVIDYLGGNCPVQAEGTINGRIFYFRARGDTWSLRIGGDPIGDPDWSYIEDYGDDPYSAGWMTDEEAEAFIRKGARIYVGAERAGPNGTVGVKRAYGEEGNAQ